VIRALRYVREDLNQDGRKLVVHGVNLSLGYDFNAKAFACGQTPICVEVNRLVQSGVVAVAAAGNTGHGTVTGLFGQREGTLLSTINDPGNAAEAITVGSTHRDMPHVYGVSWFSSKGPTGNAERAITVGSTHRDMPHMYGVSYFSSKGPTADGRPKPDLVAPGEQIASCAAGGSLKLVYGDTRPPAGHVTYVTDSGTAMACAHVSGAVAAFLSVHREFLGRPDDTKRSLPRERDVLGQDCGVPGPWACRPDACPSGRLRPLLGLTGMGSSHRGRRRRQTKHLVTRQRLYCQEAPDLDQARRRTPGSQWELRSSGPSGRWPWFGGPPLGRLGHSPGHSACCNATGQERI
jgi:subtilisin family serine protease